jgi:uncharacterized SAM-binding protein YcdF (DUF218 family)
MLKRTLLKMMRKHPVFYFKRILALSLLYGISSCSFSSKNAMRYLEKASTQTYDMISVPGVPFTEQGWDSTMKARVYWSKYLYERGIAKNIMYSGASVYSPYYEGKIMAMYAIAIGIPKEHVFWEIRAEHSTENLYYCYAKAKKLGFNHIALATDPYQAKQLKRFAKVKISKEVGIIPIVFDTLRAIQPTMINPVIDYQQAYNKDFVPLKSRASFWKRFRGTMGKNIDHDAYK